MSNWASKDPGDTRDYKIDWGPLLPADDPITDAVLTLPDGLELVSATFTDTEQVFRVSAGALGSYDVSCVVTVESGQVFKGTATLKIAVRKLN